MDTFLGKTADYLHNKYDNHLPDLCIVLPNRRASLFLRKHFSQILKKVSWSPAIYSIEDFIFKLSGLTILDHSSLLFELYGVHKEITKEKAQDFDEFIKWGQVLLHDFNEIDQHLAPAKSLFGYLSDLKSLSSWNPEHSEPTEFQKQYVSFFESLYFYYERLGEKLKSNQAAYPGMAYKYVAGQLNELIKDLNHHKIIFAGFNALSPSEEQILFNLELDGKAEILWDADEFYINKLDTEVYPEAGYFIRKYQKKLTYKAFNWIEDHFRKIKKEINIYGVPKQVGQAKLCGQLLHDFPELLTAKHNSAIVLADENLLFPILNSLPDIRDLNATMGIPLQSTPVFDFIKAVLDMLQRSFLFQKMQNRSNNAFHQNDIIKLLNHSVVNEVCEELFDIPTTEYLKHIKKISSSNKIIYTADEIKNKLSWINSAGFINILFTTWKDDIHGIIRNIRVLLEMLRDAILLKQKNKALNLKVEIENIYVLSIIFTKIHNYQSKYAYIKNAKSLASLFNQLSRSEKLSLYGEPLQGLQLMGVLETRTLDFENLIICSVNENILPGSGKQNSFIPFDIKREYDLPTYREKNAVFAYHFFRLIQRAKNIHLIYNTEADPIAGGDKSRFIYQLQNEFNAFENISISEHIVSSSLREKTKQKLRVFKSDKIIEKLKQKAKDGFSPSSLNTYKRCSLQFYFKEIARLGEAEKDKEVIDAATLGKIIHDVLQEIYEPLKLKKIESAYLEEKISSIENILKKSFDKLYEDGNIKFGKNYLIAKIAEHFIKNYLRLEIQQLKKGSQIEIKSLEEHFSGKIKINSHIFPDDLEFVRFKGIIDRIDSFDNEIRIIDYKTGSVRKTDLNIKDWESIFTAPHTDKSFQLVFYSWLYYKHSQQKENTRAGIFSLKNLSKGFMALNTPENSILTKEHFDDFEKALLGMVETLFDKQHPFEQTDDLNICAYCNYNIICNK